MSTLEEGELVTHHELLDQDTRVGDWRWAVETASHPRELLPPIRRNMPRAPEPAGGCDDDREPALLGDRPRLVALMARPSPTRRARPRTPARPCRPRLVGGNSRLAGIHPGDARVARGPSASDLKVFQNAQRPVDQYQWRAASRMPSASCRYRGSHRQRTYVTSPAASADGTAPPISSRRGRPASLGDSRGVDNRGVASSRYGATKTTLGTDHGRYPFASRA